MIKPTASEYSTHLTVTMLGRMALWIFYTSCEPTEMRKDDEKCQWRIKLRTSLITKERGERGGGWARGGVLCHPLDCHKVGQDGLSDLVYYMGINK